MVCIEPTLSRWPNLDSQKTVNIVHFELRTLHFIRVEARIFVSDSNSNTWFSPKVGNHMFQREHKLCYSHN